MIMWQKNEPPSAQNLSQAIKDVCVTEITQEHRVCLASSMPRRIQAAIAAKEATLNTEK